MFRAIFSARREENGCGSRIGREKAHFLGVKWSGGRVAKNDQRQIFRALWPLPTAIQRGPTRAWIDVRANISSAWPISLRHYDPRCPPRRARSRSDRFAFDTHGYVRAVRVENGGCQFLFLRSKDSRRVVAMP